MRYEAICTFGDIFTFLFPLIKKLEANSNGNLWNKKEIIQIKDLFTE